MSADPQAVQALFARAIEFADQSERKKFLADQCSDNVELYERVAKLLDAFDRSKGFLEPPSRDLAITLLNAESGYQPGHVISGRYKLLEAIGEGGMGTVWVAEQTQPVRRRVALKLVKPGMDSKQVLARFDAERQALALMDHPNIAKVFDGGVTDQGRPFFAMELVKGMPVTEYSDQMRLSVEERLKLFVPICQAVQHAHQKGIIHRDLKPSNVLVCLYDGKPVPKVIDFGLAKAMHQPLTEQTVHTGFGLMVGTPLYMSPEQAEHNNLDVDTRADVYSLGVMLYELLTGSTPLEKAQFKHAALDEILRLIKEVEPPKPSTRISSSAKLPNIAAQRNLDPDKLGRCIRGDLDWIVMKAIDKERNRRYETANGLARDIERFLNLEAVEACPPTTGYRLRRLTRKHRAALGTAAAFAAILVLGTALSGWQAFRATNAEALASQRLVEVRIEQQKTQEALEDTQARKLEAERLKLAADKLNVKLTEAAAAQRRAIYASEMNLVRLEAQRGNLQRVREILMEQLPTTGDDDLRGFEWNYWYRYLTRGKVIHSINDFHYGETGSAAMIAPGGRFGAVTEGETTRIIELPSGQTRGTAEFQLWGAINRNRMSSDGRILSARSASQFAYWPNGTTYQPNQVTVYEPDGRRIDLLLPVDAIQHLSFADISQDGKFVAAIGNDTTHQPDNPVCRLIVWNVDSREVILDQIEHRELNRLQFNQDAMQIVGFLCHGTLRHSNSPREVAVVFEVATGKELGTAKYNDDIDGLYVVPNKNQILLSTLGYSGNNRKELLTWSPPDSEPHRMCDESMPDYVKGVVSPDGHWFAVGGHTVPSIRLIDTTNGRVINRFHNEAAMIDTLTFSTDGSQLQACSTKGEFLTWDLEQNQDLFKLRANPLPQLCSQGAQLNDEQTLLAIALADGSVRVRRRDGQETVLCAAATKPIQRGHSKFWFSPDSRTLAYTTNVQFDGRTNSNSIKLELYDLKSGNRIWSKRGFSPIDLVDHCIFSSDGRKLRLRNQKRIDCLTGSIVPANSNTPQSEIVSDTVRQYGTDRVLHCRAVKETDRWRMLQIVDADRDEVLAQSEELTWPLTSSYVTVPSPDGKHVARVRPVAAQVEIWDVAASQQVVNATGNIVVFSQDGRHCAVSTRPYQVRGNTITIQSQSVDAITIWDVTNGQPISQLSLSGDNADTFQFSPDGSRLLTLHGTQAAGSGGAVPSGRLWEIASGREIMSIPVAEVNHYMWDLVFDPTGNQLTSLVYAKSAGTAGGLGATTYDATPLDPVDDANLVAKRIVARLAEEHLLARDVVAAIEADTKFAALVRKTALELARKRHDDPDALADKVLPIITNQASFPGLFQAAYATAEALNRLEPDSLRSKVLLAGTLYRIGRNEEAMSILDALPDAPTNPTKDEFRYHLLKQGFNALLEAKQGVPARYRPASVTMLQFAQKHQDKSTRADSQVQALLSEVLALRRDRATNRERDQEAFGASVFKSFDENNKDVSDQFLAKFDRDKNGELSLDEFSERNSLAEDFSRFDKDGDLSLNRVEFRYAYRAHRSFTMTSLFVSRGEFRRAIDIHTQILDRTPNLPIVLNARAWLLATCPDAKLRNGEQAIADAIKACELRQWKAANYTDTLAAAYAEVGRFEEAVAMMNKALTLVDEKQRPAYEERLQLYEKKQPFHQRAVSFSISDSDTPLLSASEIASATRVTGWGASWSPDGRKLVRNKKRDANESYDLEIIDLESADTTALCKGGVDPYWSPSPGGPIAFVRGPEGQKRTSKNETIWLIETDGSNLRKIVDGGFPTITSDGSLYFCKQTAPGVSSLFRMELNADSPPQEVIHASPYPTVSFDGKLIADTIQDMRGLLAVTSITNPQDSVTIRTGIVGGGAGWSPNGRYIAFGSWTSQNNGLWLIDLHEKKINLLANAKLTMPRWSPDGTRIACDDRIKGEVLILDLTHLNLPAGLPALP